ncbi:MAG: AAA family ATPase [Nitrospirae bacterium]|nr:AAA family ATPase [Nitrospirota bacterium]
MQRLIIKNFGPIEEVDLEINDIMIFIGPQASGKSTISKAVYFFKSLKDELIRYIFSIFGKQNLGTPIDMFATIMVAKFVATWGQTQHLSNTYLKYEYKEGVSIEITINGIDSVQHFSEIFSQKLSEIINRVELFLSRHPSESEKKIFLTEIEGLSNELFSDERDVIFIPAGRSLFATLSDQIKFIDLMKLDYGMVSFTKIINDSKHIFSQSLTDLVRKKTQLTQAAEHIISKILKASYRFEDDEDRLYFSKTGYTKLTYASSGQQEAMWILLLIFLIIQEKKDFFVMIEEPEAHLYPETQKDIIDLICLLSNLKNNQIIITTHSPYIMSSFNNLLYAYNVDKKGVPNVSDIVNRQLWINPDRLSAYFVDKGGIKSIIDEEFQMIKTEAIDSASEIIDDVYSKLFDIDPE